ncbi:MAG: hypothetical protein KKA36_05410 [Gammaproteobacteria bacterium]|nr:hypothetical protein [Gammaproteobacteria bacterium]MBU2478508.1 hypothetical protein [Gammaproteobacteria bacterium]
MALGAPGASLTIRPINSYTLQHDTTTHYHRKHWEERAMIGKKNIVFGLLFLVLTAGLGPYMVTQLYPAVGEAQTAKQTAMSNIQLMASNNFEQDLEPMSAEQIARANTAGLLTLNQQLNARAPVDAIKGGPHAHGNLEALLNIAIGVVLCFVAVSVAFKQLISWLFILGTLLHSGLLYLVTVFSLPWAGQLLDLGIGPIMILLGLLLAGIAVAIGFRGALVTDA